jgi:hypothetical protein
LPEHAKPAPRRLLPLPDALVKVAESYLAHGESEGTGGERTQVFVHLDQDPLAPDGTLAATLDDGTRISAETFRCLACDTALVAAKHSPTGNILDLGRRTRTISPALRRALWLRDRGCAFPGCPHHRYLHAHHIHHWLHGGKTALTNLVLLCTTHHRVLHEGGFTITRSAEGTLEFRTPRGLLVDAAAPVPAQPERWWGSESPPTLSTVEDDDCDDITLPPTWDGTPMEYDLAVHAVLHGGT